jgi:DNA N-6-adenine-methyltransferase (Dam)
MSEHEQSTGLSSEWYTPLGIFEALGLEFDLDPCSPGPGHWVPARKIYTAADNGLAQPWRGLVFMNPPFGGRRGQVPWLRKFFAHGNGIALVAARISADWFHSEVVPHAQLLLFPRGKTKFVRPNGSIGKEPGTGVALIGAGRIACAALLRSGLGACYAPVPSLAPMTNDEKATRQADADERTLDRIQAQILAGCDASVNESISDYNAADDFMHEHYRNHRRCRLGRKGRSGVKRRDHRHLTMNQIGREYW